MIDEPITNERTSPQVLVTVYGEDLPRPASTPKTFYKKVREMRRDPTIALARWLSIAPVLCAKWSIEAEKTAPAGAKEFVSEQMTSLRGHLLSTAFYGCLDFGWQSFEKVFVVDAKGFIVLKKLKPLLHDITDILVDEKNGSFKGLYQPAMGGFSEVILDVQECLLLNFDVEGTNWYGESTMKIVEQTYDKWLRAEEGADRYDRKMAGSHWIIHYPFGSSVINGTETDNFIIAKQIMARLESSGSVAVPRTIAEYVDDMNKDAPDAWKIELLSSQGGQTGFIDRMKYLDALKVRAFGFPERSLLEGTMGTKAEAETHANIGLTFQEYRHQHIVQLINWHVVNQLLRLNYGPGHDNTVYIQPTPLTDTALTYLRDVYKTILLNPEMLMMELGTMDMQALKDRLGIPILPPLDVVAEGNESEFQGTDPMTDDQIPLPVIEDDMTGTF